MLCQGSTTPGMPPSCASALHPHLIVRRALRRRQGCSTHLQHQANSINIPVAGELHGGELAGPQDI